MTLQEVPVVANDSEEYLKYVVVELKDSTGATKTVVRTGQYPHDITYNLLENEMFKNGIECKKLGVGEIDISHKNKTISIYRFIRHLGGEPDPQLTVDLFRGAYPEYFVKISLR